LKQKVATDVIFPVAMGHIVGIGNGQNSIPMVMRISIVYGKAILDILKILFSSLDVSVPRKLP
jgi:hypothetical protein